MTDLHDKEEGKEITEEAMLKAVIAKTNYMLYGFTIEELCKKRLYFSILFDHSFAKAYWGEKVVCSFCGKEVSSPKNYKWCKCSVKWTKAMYEWEYHLQQAVIATDPLIYYYERL